jgi:hypothetical protein
MIYELRTYESTPGNVDNLHRRFSDHTVGLFKKHGIGMFGFWDESVSPAHMVLGHGDSMTYMLSFEDVAEREKKWAAFRADPDWAKARAASEANGPLVAQVHNTLMRTTAFSPEPKFTTQVHELRYYNAWPGRMPDLERRFIDHADGLLKEHGMEVIGYWNDEVGTSNTLVWMIGFDSVEHREACWISFLKDERWHRAFGESHRNGPIMTGYHAKLLRVTPYSPKH